MNYESPGRVSVWLGNLQSSDELSKLLEEREDGDSLFCRVLGVDWIDHDFCESLFIANGEDAERFIGYFSYSSSFADNAGLAAVALGLPRANAAIVVYDFDYRPPPSRPPMAMTFLGSFAYTKTVPARYSRP
jgi:hypothetical protein